MKKRYTSKCIKVSNASTAVRTNIPAKIRDLLDVKAGDTIQWNIHDMGNHKVLITINKNEE